MTFSIMTYIVKWLLQKYSEHPSHIDTKHVLSFLMKTQDYSLNNFQIYLTAVLASCSSFASVLPLLVTTNMISFSMRLTSLFCFCFLIPQKNEIIQYLSFYFWLISLNIIPSRSSHAVASDMISHCLWMNNIPLYNVQYLHIQRVDLFTFVFLLN